MEAMLSSEEHGGADNGRQQADGQVAIDVHGAAQTAAFFKAWRATGTRPCTLFPAAATSSSRPSSARWRHRSP
jgi:hypothetical protein